MPLLKRILKGEKMGFREVNSAKQAIYLLQKGKPSPVRKKASGVRKQEKRANHREETARIRERVFQRAGGACEACRTGFVSWGRTMDHFYGGTGKSQRQTVENCWVLCGTPSIPGSCHYLRQRNEPSVSLWNERFRKHCERYGYPILAHIEHATVKKPGNAPQAQELVIPEVPHD